MAWTLIQHDESDSSHEFPRLSTGDYWQVDSIPDTYDHLKVVGFVQLDSNTSSSMNLLHLFFNYDGNGDATGGTYTDCYMQAYQSAGVNYSNDTNRAQGARMAYQADDGMLGTFSSFTLMVLNYCSGSTMHRHFMCRSGISHNNNDYYYNNMMLTGSWRDTDPIDSIRIEEGWGNDSGFQRYSTMSLYGISVS